ncbi:unnamed protein product [Cylicocyclus nassatus]|uniref:Uncharacterized protein n=1 Tax=Cylicocyclus nassatus TaxID=53992 RepID=A0AA36H596_CYLNA|nr:unnamed protein product [Cylicocyclus nassatus]
MLNSTSDIDTNKFSGFYGLNRMYVALYYTFLSVASIMLNLLFLYGIRDLCGWDSRFSFTLLFFASVISILRFVVQLVACLLAIIDLDWIRYQTLWIAFGSAAYASYFTAVILSMCITFNRLIYTVFPAETIYIDKKITKIIIGALILCFASEVVLLNTRIMSSRWIPQYMVFAENTWIEENKFPEVNTLSNYVVGIFNLVAYALIFALLTKRRLFTLRRNGEIRMTLQVLIMILCELFFFIYWEHFEMEAYGPLDLILAETSSLLYFDIFALPYLILNENVHQRLKWKRNNVVDCTVGNTMQEESRNGVRWAKRPKTSA